MASGVADTEEFMLCTSRERLDVQQGPFNGARAGIKLSTSGLPRGRIWVDRIYRFEYLGNRLILPLFYSGLRLSSICTHPDKPALDPHSRTDWLTGPSAQPR